MHPFIRPGDRVAVIPSNGLDETEFNPGDCVVFRDRGKRWLVHRVIRSKAGKGNLLTKGDSLLHPDHPVPAEAIAGRVTEVERAGTGRIHRLDRPPARRISRIIALLSRGEAAIFSARSGRRPDGHRGPVFRLIRFPRWLLTRVFFP